MIVKIVELKEAILQNFNTWNREHQKKKCLLSATTTLLIGDKSKYFQCLSNESKKRYLVKISRIENVDPYTLKKENLNFDADCFPKISYSDIMNYLLFAPSPVTAEELKFYKNMEAYNYFLCVWVEIATKSFKDESRLILGKVSKYYSFKGSQRLHGYYKKYLTVSNFPYCLD